MTFSFKDIVLGTKTMWGRMGRMIVQSLWRTIKKRMLIFMTLTI
jgi:hypothetical protein